MQTISMTCARKRAKFSLAEGDAGSSGSIRRCPPLGDGNQEPPRRRSECLRQCGRPSCVEIELDPELAEPSEFASIGWIAHPMQEADRRIAEMYDAGFDQNRVPQPRRPHHLQGKLECRVAFAFGLEVGSRRAD